MRHIKSFSRRAAAFTLALLLSLPIVYADAGERVLQTSTEITGGLTYRNTVTVNGGSRVESFALELEPDAGVQPILLQGDGTIYGGGSISHVVSTAQAAGWHVLGAINTDFFAMSTGVPMGVVIEDGIYKSSPGTENAMTIKDGRVSITRTPQVSLTLYNHTTGLNTVPDAFNKTRSEYGGTYLLNGHFSNVSTRSTGSGWYVRMRALPDPYTGQVSRLTVNSSLALEVTELLLSDQAITIGPDEYILTADDKSNRADVFASFQVGDQIVLSTSCGDALLSDAQWACGVGDVMVEDGVITDSSSWVYAHDGRQPRSAMGIKSDGSLVFYAVDGRQSNYSVGLSQLDLARELQAQGCVTAVNLDGGGSTALSVWVPGRTGPAMQSKPSGGGKGRSCATYLLLVADRYGSGDAQRLALPEHGQVVLTGSSLPLSQPVAVDEGLAPVSADLSRLTYTAQTGLGGVDPYTNTYTAGPIPGEETLLLSTRTLQGTAQLHVVNQLTDFTVTQVGSSTPLSSLRVKAGDQIQLAVSGSYYGRTALRDFGPVTCTVQGEVGSVDQNGLFTASQTPGEGSITLSAGGQSKTISVLMGNVHNDVTPDHWAYQAVEYCYAHSIASGISSTEFGRDYPIIRGDFLLMLYNAMGKPAVTAPCTFTDVKETDHFYTALAWGQQMGLASGVGEGRFAPREYITREQAFSLLHRFLPVAGKTCPDGSLSVLDQFQDKDKIAGFAQIPSATLVSQGLASGSGGMLDPKGTLTRAQMASLLYRVLEHTPITPTDPVTPPTDPTDPADPTDPVDPGVIPGNYLLALDRSQVELASGGSVTLSASILPHVEGARITWTSSDPASAPVTSGGMVTNLYPGDGSTSVTITASWNGQSASCAVTCQPAAHTGTVVNAENGLNVRSGPGTTYDKVGALRNSSQVVVLAQESGWYQVLFRNPDGQAAIGYVLSDYLSLNR